MPVRIEHSGEVVTAFLEGELDHHQAQGIRADIDDYVTGVSPALLILDFTGVSFMDSSGIGLVMGRYRLMSGLGGSLQVTNTTAHISKVMRLAGLDRLNVLTKGGNPK